MRFWETTSKLPFERRLSILLASEIISGKWVELELVVKLLKTPMKTRGDRIVKAKTKNLFLANLVFFSISFLSKILKFNIVIQIKVGVLILRIANNF